MHRGPYNGTYKAYEVIIIMPLVIMIVPEAG